MEYYIKVLMVDDDPRYSKPLSDRVYNDYGIELTLYENWEEARTELHDFYFKYSAVILDVMGKLNRDTTGEDPRHVTKALKEIAGMKTDIPVFILTGHPDYAEEIIEEQIFKKNEDEDRLFCLIKAKYSSSEKNKVSRKSPEAMDFADNNFNNEELEIFINLFKDEKLSENITGDAGNLRILNERCVDVLGLKMGKFNHIDDLIKFIRESGGEIKSGSRSVDIVNYLNLEKLIAVPKCIESNFKSIYYTCSAIGPHAKKGGTFIPSAFQIEAFKYQLLENMIWINRTINKK